MNLRFVGRRMTFQVLPVIGESRNVVALDVVQRIGQGHLPVVMMVTVRFTVRRNVHQLVPLSAIVEGAYDPVRKSFTTRQQLLESNRARNRPVVKKHGDRAVRGQPNQVRPSRIDLPSVDITRIALSNFFNAAGLVW